MMAAALPGSVYSDYDGRLRLYWPDDLYIVGSAPALVALRRAIDAALTRGMAACTGLHCDPEEPSIYAYDTHRIIVMLARPENLSPELADKPQHIAQHPGIVTLFKRDEDVE